MISPNTMSTIKQMLNPAAAAGVIPPGELKELLDLAKFSVQPEPNACRQHDLLTLQEASTILRLHVKSIHEYARAGLLEKVKLGRHASRITASSLYSFIDSRKAQK